MRLEYSLRAQADLLGIFSYLNDRNPRSAVTVVGEIRKQIESLLDFPLKGYATSFPGAHRLKISRYRYFVFYRLEGDMISIIHIRHTSRRPWGGADD